MEMTRTRMSRGKRRPVAGRDEIIAAALAIGNREGWQAVTIRSVSQEFGYSSPLLYEHFENKEDLLTQIAVKGLQQLATLLTQETPANSRDAVLVMVQRYWSFVLEQTPLYRLMNGMDGPLIDNTLMGDAAQSICNMVATAVRPLLSNKTKASVAHSLADELWALLHGMAALRLDRGTPFEMEQVQSACMRLIQGSNVDPAEPRR